jgi:hypothetical protein
MRRILGVLPYACVYNFHAPTRHKSRHLQDKPLTETPSDAYELWNSGLRWLISSIPIRRRPSSRSILSRCSLATRSRIRPTVRQEQRINSATAVLEQLTASQQTWSSNALVKRLS